MRTLIDVLIVIVLVVVGFVIGGTTKHIVPFAYAWLISVAAGWLACDISIRTARRSREEGP